MSLETCFGPELNVFEESAEHAKRLVISSPILSHKKLQSILINPYFKCDEIQLAYKKNDSLRGALKLLQKKAVNSIKRDTIIHLDETLPDRNSIPINSLLAVGCVHQKLVELGLRSKANIIVTSSSARDTIKLHA